MLYKMCQTVATFFCVKKYTLKQNRAAQVENKQEPYIIPFLSVK